MATHMLTGDRTYMLSTRQVNAAINGGIGYLIPWPEHIIGEYGSGTFDGSPTSPKACDRVMDAYVADVLGEQFPSGRMKLRGNPDLVIHSVIAGRKQTASGLTPCIVVRIGPEGLATGFDRETWAQERPDGAYSLRDAVAGCAFMGKSAPIKVASKDWPEACRQAFDGEMLDGDAEGCPDSDEVGWYPLVYRCQAGEWRGRMERCDA